MEKTKWITTLLFVAALAFVLPACSDDDDDDDDTISTYSTPLAVVNGAIKSADMSESGVSSSRSAARVLSNSDDSDKNREEAAVSYMTGEDDISPVIQILESLSKSESLTEFNNDLLPNHSLKVSVGGMEFSVVVDKIKITSEADGSLFYIYGSCTCFVEDDESFPVLFLLKCTVNSFGTLDTDIYYPNESKEFAQTTWTTTGKHRTAYRLQLNDKGDKEDFYSITAASSGVEAYWKRVENQGSSKITLASNWTYTGAFELGMYDRNHKLLFDKDGNVLCKTKYSDVTEWIYGENKSVYDSNSSLVDRAEAMQESFPSDSDMDISSAMEALKTLLEAWNN